MIYALVLFLFFIMYFLFPIAVTISSISFSALHYITYVDPKGLIDYLAVFLCIGMTFYLFYILIDLIKETIYEIQNGGDNK